MEDIANSAHMEMLWDNYKNSNSYVGDLSWDEVLNTVTDIVLDDIKNEPIPENGFEMTVL